MAMDFSFFLSLPLQTYKDFKVQRAGDCQPENGTYPVRLTDMKAITTNDTVLLSGRMEILEELPMNIEMELTLTRCNLDRTGCFFFDKLIFSRICEKMKTKTSVAWKIISGIRPSPSCPIAIGNYEMMNDSKFSIEMFKYLPLEGYLWRTRYTFYEKSGLKRIRPLSCLESETAVVIMSHRISRRRH